MNFVEIENQTKLKILKIVLLQKIVFKILYRSKEERIKNLEKWVRKGYVTDFDLDEMIAALKAELEKTAEQRNAEAKERIQKEMEVEAEAEYRRRMEDEQYNQSREYGPSCPWNAPGMSVSDFIGLRLVTQPYPHAYPCMRFLFVRPEICLWLVCSHIQLPSDS